MAEEMVQTAEGGGKEFSSPPAAGIPVKEEFSPRKRLHELANELVRTQNRQMLVEFLRLRRACR